MAPHPLSVAVVRALGALVHEGVVPWQGALPDADQAEDARVTREGAGYATSLPLRLAGRTGLPAEQLAGLLADRLGAVPGVGSATVAGPGYVEVAPDPLELVRAAIGPVARRGQSGALDPLPPGDLPEQLSEAVAEVGADAVRFALARRTTAGPLDLALLGRADERNPVHAVQLAHARLVGSLRQAADLGVGPAEAADPGLLDEPAEAELASAVVEADAGACRAVRLDRPDLLARHLSSTAEAAHRWLSSRRALPSGDEEPDDAHRARLRLAVAARDTLGHGLDLLGVTAPERM
ncbi:MAG TPA: DALR anticodon-binding domain-containing protein [Marmoricola sp.]|nr:DALR anticodon-binding domain-containing protein [Marmoricola sp.]